MTQRETADLRVALTPLEVEAKNANAGMRGSMTATQAEDAITGILEHGLRLIPGTTKREERQFNDGYAFGLYRARDILARVAATPSPAPSDGLRATVPGAVTGLSVPYDAKCPHCRAALSAPVQGLDAAWAAAEAALPRGWVLSMDPTDGADYHFMADKKTPMDEWDDGGVDATGPTPTAALQALAARLSEESR